MKVDIERTASATDDLHSENVDQEQEDIDMVSISPGNLKLFEDLITKKNDELRTEIYAELEMAIQEMSESLYAAIKSTTADTLTNPNTGTVRENKKVTEALKTLKGSLEQVQTELGRQSNLAKLAQASSLGPNVRRSSLYYGNAEHTQRFFILRSILTTISCIPSPLLVFGGAILGDDVAYYRMAVAAWPVEALFVLLHFVITVERSTREPNPEEKVHFVLHFICHWASIIIYLAINPDASTSPMPAIISMMILTSTPLYYMLKQVREWAGE